MSAPVRTAGQLAALPEKTIVRDRFGDVGVVQAGRVHFPETNPQTFARTAKKYAPLEVVSAAGPIRDAPLDLRATAELLGLALVTMRTYHRDGRLPKEDGRFGTIPWWYTSTILEWQANRPGSARREAGK